jgi:hypothetical protein
MEANDAPAALGGVVVRLADQIGLTPAGLKENGWKIAPAEETKPAARRTTGGARRSSSRGRLRVVAGGGA